MFYALLADFIGVIHFGYVSFVVAGLVLILLGIVLQWAWIRRWPFRITHLVMIAIVALESLGEIMCPLTVWEKQLRVLAGQPPSGDSFVADLLNRIMFFDCVPYNHWIFKSSYVSFAALVVMTLVIAPPRRRSKSMADLQVSRGLAATALLATLSFIFLYTSWCMEDYKRGVDAWREDAHRTAAQFPTAERSPLPVKEDRLPVYLLAFTGINFGGLFLLSWGLLPRKARAGSVGDGPI